MKIKRCSGILSKFKGLMFTFPLKKGWGVLLENSSESIYNSSIHMFFVFYPIDVVWLDSGFKVVDVKRSVKPFTPIVFPKRKAKYVLELWKDGARGIREGDLMDL
tara:strand:- start:7411 stop:7725 length:315 start_codon:yes stop_codon:yes gene_type:complete